MLEVRRIGDGAAAGAYGRQIARCCCCWAMGTRSFDSFDSPDCCCCRASTWLLLEAQRNARQQAVLTSVRDQLGHPGRGECGVSLT